MVCAYEWHAEELHNVEEHPNRHKGSDGYIPAVSKLELFLARVFS